MHTIAISPLKAAQLEEITPLLRSSRNKPYRFLAQRIPNEIDALWLKEIQNGVQNGELSAFVAVQNACVAGLIVYSDLSWDSRVLGRQMGTIRYLITDPTLPSRFNVATQLLDYGENWAVERGCEFLLCKTYTDDMSTIHALEDAGFNLVDTLLDYVYDQDQCPLAHIQAPPNSAQTELRLADRSDVDALIDVARQSFQLHFGRYHADRFISHQQAIAVYEAWVTSSFNGYADWILLAEIDHQIAGFSIWKGPSPMEQELSIRLGHYSIAATHPNFRGRGLFGMLTYGGMQLLSTSSSCVEGPTHINNYPVQHGYSKLGWRITDARHSFHRWLVE